MVFKLLLSFVLDFVVKVLKAFFAITAAARVAVVALETAQRRGNGQLVEAVPAAAIFRAVDGTRRSFPQSRTGISSLFNRLSPHPRVSVNLDSIDLRSEAYGEH